MNWAYQAVLPAAGQEAVPISVTAGAGVFGLSGRGVRVSAFRKTQPPVGYFQTYSSVEPLILRRLNVVPLTIAFGGKSAAITRTRRLPPATGAYRARGNFAGLTTFRSMTAVTAQYAVAAGVSVLRMIAGMIDAAGDRVFVIGAAPAFEVARRISGECGVFASSNEPVDIEAAIILTADSKNFDTQGQECSIMVARKIIASQSVMAITCRAPACNAPPAGAAPSTLRVGVTLGL